MFWALKDELQAVPTNSDSFTDLGHCDTSWCCSFYRFVRSSIMLVQNRCTASARLMYNATYLISSLSPTMHLTALTTARWQYTCKTILLALAYIMLSVCHVTHHLTITALMRTLSSLSTHSEGWGEEEGQACIPQPVNSSYYIFHDNVSRLCAECWW